MRVNCILFMMMCDILFMNVIFGMYECVCFFVFQAEDGIRDLVRSRGLGDVYKRQGDRAWRLPPA